MTESIKILRELLIADWQKTANMFIPVKENSLSYIDKHKDDYWMLDQHKVLERERNMNIVRWVLDTTSLRRNLKDCTPKEIADDKLNRLMKLTENRPELIKVIDDIIL